MFDIQRLTGAGTGAVAVLRLRGEDILSLLVPYLRKSTGSPYSLEELQLEATSSQKRPLFAYLLLEWDSTETDSFDSSVPLREETVLYLKSPSEIELNCHGGEGILTVVIDLLRSLGGEVSDPLARREGETCSETARRLLPYALTQRCAEILIDQMNGAARLFFQELLTSLEEKEWTLLEAAASLRRIAEYERLGTHLTEPFKVILAGNVNAGKSTLMNQILGFERAITASIAGTTRDVLTAESALEGFPIRLYDTAGLRESSDLIEQAGMKAARQILESADFVLILQPSDQQEIQFSEEIRSFCQRQKIPYQILLTKADLLKEGEETRWQERLGEELFPYSNQTPESLTALEKTLVQRLVPDLPSPGTALPLTPEETAFYLEVAESLEGGNPLSEEMKAAIIRRLS